MRRLFTLLVVGLGWCASAGAAVIADEVAYKDGDIALKGYLAYDDAVKGRRPGILVVHEWWGPTRHVRGYARELAAKGYTALAVDMYGTVATDPKAAGELMNGLMAKPDVVKSRFETGKKVLAAHPSVNPKRASAEARSHCLPQGGGRSSRGPDRT